MQETMCWVVGKAKSLFFIYGHDFWVMTRLGNWAPFCLSVYVNCLRSGGPLWTVTTLDGMYIL